MDISDIPDRLDMLLECRVKEKELQRNGTVRLEFEVGHRGTKAPPMNGTVYLTKEALRSMGPKELHRTLESAVVTDVLHAASGACEGSDWPYGSGVCWQCMAPTGN